MTILPGSLDYLYYNGILDHIPYEAYELPPVGKNCGREGFYISGAQYMDMAMSGKAYGNYNTSADSYAGSSSWGNSKIGQDYSFRRAAYGKGNGIGDDADFEVQISGTEGKERNKSIRDGFSYAKDKVINAPSIVKGLASLALIAGTLVLLIKGKKKP